MKYCCNKLSMVFTSVMKPLHTKRGGVCILEAKIIDPEFGERFAFKQTDGTIAKRSDKELRLTITHCPYCGTPLKFLFQNLDKDEKDT
jgi:hypothetical protein